jgi:hypothetical protein
VPALCKASYATGHLISFSHHPLTQTCLARLCLITLRSTLDQILLRRAMHRRHVPPRPNRRQRLCAVAWVGEVADVDVNHRASMVRMGVAGSIPAGGSILHLAGANAGQICVEAG